MYGRCYCHKCVVDVITTCIYFDMFILHWQMLLPFLWQILLPCCCGRCCYPLIIVICLFCKAADAIAFVYVVDGKTTNYLIVILADVIAMVADGMATQGGLYLADVNAMVADGITTGQPFFRFSSEMFNRISSQMCGRWKLPTFLFWHGLLALLCRELI